MLISWLTKAMRNDLALNLVDELLANIPKNLFLNITKAEIYLLAISD